MKIVWVAGFKEVPNGVYSNMTWYVLPSSTPENWNTRGRFRGDDQVGSEAFYPTKEAAARMAQAVTDHCNRIHRGSRSFTGWYKARRVP